MQIRDRFRTALVTGARTGLGAEFTDMLLAEKIEVWGTSRSPRNLPRKVNPVRLELTDPDSVVSAWEQAESESGGIDILINNAGTGSFGAIDDVPPRIQDGQHEMFFVAPARLGSAAYRAMRDRDRGCIVSVTSLAVEFPIPFMSGYNAGKAALSAWTSSLELEARTTHVTVIDFRPGDYHTAFNVSMASSSDFSRGDPRHQRVWSVLEKNIAMAPEPARAARDLRRAIRKGRSGVVRSGGFFQARLAPMLSSLAPRPLVIFFLRRYFHLG